MKYVTITKEADAQLKGVRVSFEKVDKELRAVLLTDAAGRLLRVQVANTYSANVAVLGPEPLPAVWRASGRYLGVTPVNRDFETEADGREFLQELSGAAGLGRVEHHGASDQERFGVALTEVAPEPVAQVEPRPADDIPF